MRIDLGGNVNVKNAVSVVYFLVLRTKEPGRYLFNLSWYETG